MFFRKAMLLSVFMLSGASGFAIAGPEPHFPPPNFNKNGPGGPNGCITPDEYQDRQNHYFEMLKHHLGITKDQDGIFSDFIKDAKSKDVPPECWGNEAKPIKPDDMTLADKFKIEEGIQKRHEERLQSIKEPLMTLYSKLTPQQRKILDEEPIPGMMPPPHHPM